MSMRVFREADASLEALVGERVAVIGYGIQGRAQALNLRDSGIRVCVGNREDEYARRAREDGFDVLPIAEATAAGQLILLLVPDEIQPPLYEGEIRGGLRPGDGLVFAHGFAVHFGLIHPPEEVDVMLLAPRLPGRYVRERFLAGGGVPAYVDVARDASGRAWERLLALAVGIGALRAGALAVSFARETELDLFSEQFVLPLIFRALEIAYEELVAAGHPPELAVMELHGSGELGQVLVEASRTGLYEMLRRHGSPVCRYGVLSRRPGALDETHARARARETVARIRDGSFARELLADAGAGHPALSKLTTEAERRPLAAGEAALWRIMPLE